MSERDIMMFAAFISMIVVMLLFVALVALFMYLMDSGYRNDCVRAFLENCETERECRKLEQIAFVRALWDIQNGGTSSVTSEKNKILDNRKAK